MFRSILRFDLLLIILFFLFFIEKIFLFNRIVIPIYMLFFFFFVPFVYLIENRIKINIFVIFFSYIFIRTLFNILLLDDYLFDIGFSTTIQILSYALIIPAICYVVQYHESRINLILNSIKVFILLNIAILVLSKFNIYIFNVNLYESYGNRYFGIIGDQFPWMITFMIAYSVYHKQYLILIFCFIALAFSGSLNASLVALVIVFYYVFKSIKIKNILLIIVINIIILLIEPLANSNPTK